MKISINQPNIILPTSKGAEVVAIHNIVRIEAVSNYSKLFFSDGRTFVVAKLLKWFEEKLNSGHFIRVHHTHLINTNFIRQYVKGKRGKVGLNNGEWIDVSRRKKSLFVKNWLNAAA